MSIPSSIFYSPSTGGFYTLAIHGDAMPADVVGITDAEHTALLAAQASGEVITAGADGYPEAIAPPAPPLDDLKARLCASVDAAADAIYVAIGGPSPGRLAEYQQAKADASSFKAASYGGTVPATVACWAQAQGWTAQQACDDILATAAAWEGALVAIRTARLTGKANVNAAADATGAQDAAGAAVATIRAVPAGL